MTSRALLLAPSRGLGGGIERYVETLEWAFASIGISCKRTDLIRADIRGHIHMVKQGRMFLRGSQEPASIVVAHRSLLPDAVLLARGLRINVISAICHGNDVWGTRRPARRRVEQHLMRRPGIRMVAVSSFTAGALASYGPSNVLLPGLSGPWFETLTGTSTAASDGNGYRIVTAFRLSQWQDKGLPELMQAVSVLERSDVSVIVCGTGAVPVSLEEFSNKYPGCVIRPGLSDWALARELAAADLFVLATRSRRGRRPSGEGFGLVLLEAQLAGTPVVGPAFGGSHDAYLEGVTGATPVDEGAASLAAVLEELLGDPEGLKRMGTQAGEWARTCFAPELYASRAAAILL